MHLALICPELHGHLNPMTTLGGELVRGGHRVTLIGTPDARPAAVRCGIGFEPIGLPEHQSGFAAEWQAKLARMTGFAALRFTGQLLHQQAEIGLRDAGEVLKYTKADAVVVDQVSPAGAAVADALGLPFVMVCNALAVHQEPAVPPAVTPWRYRTGWLGRFRNRLGNTLLGIAARPIARAVNDYRRRHGLAPYGYNANEDFGLAQVAQQPAFFDFPRERLPSHFHYTAPWHRPGRDADVAFPWEKLDGRPLVYASLGTLQNRLRHVFAAILDGCSTLDIQLVLSLGRAEAAWDGPVPPNAIVVPFAPQLRLLNRAAALITHAGLNTALEGLARGRPMLCLPVTNDQPGVARRVEWLGAGDVLKPTRATAARVRDAVRRLLSDGRYRTAAKACADQLAGVSGVANAAEIVEDAFQTGKRVVRRESAGSIATRSVGRRA